MRQLRGRSFGSERGLLSLCYLSLAWAALGCTSESPDGGSSGSGGASGGSPASGGGGGALPSGGMPATGGANALGGAGAPANAGANAGGSAGAAGSTAGGGSAGGGSGGAPVVGDRSPEGTCTRWKADTASVSEGTWSGSVDGCVVGDISADGRDNALRLFNLVRWLGDLPPVVTEESRNQQAQACALMMDAQGKLSHEPPMDWKCYSKLGADGAKTSNISGGPGVSSVLAYMIDDGNLTTFGHRRIILSNELGPIGLGSTGQGGASCMQNIGGTGKAGKAWMAWPPPGPFPMQAYGNDWSSLDETGWSIQSKSIDLSGASVTITSSGAPRPVQVEQLTGSYGQAKAIRIAPDGWEAAAGETYSVSVSGVSTPIAYEVQMIDCE
jgi:hypothetical protein